MRTKLVTLAILLGCAAPLMAQNPVTATVCNGRTAVGYIGISGIDCNCTISTPGSGKEWFFRTEPKITSLEMDSRAGRLLKVGDVITAVNGKLITTREGAHELANIAPGESVVLTVRRAGQVLRYAITAESACPNDMRLFGIYAPGLPGTPPPSPGATPAPGLLTPATPAPSAWSGSGEMPPTPRVYGVAPGATPRATSAYSTPRATFGMGLTCSNCTMAFAETEKNSWEMRFTKPPEVYSIERGGPADKAGIRRGDVITHIDGKPIDSVEGGKLFATAKPGQTVKFTIVRNNSSKTYSVKAAERTPQPSPAYAASSESLLKARQSLLSIQRTQEEQLRRLQEEIRHSQQTQDAARREAQRLMLREEEAHRSQLAQLSTAMSKAESQMRAAMADSARSVCTAPLLAPPAPGKSTRTLRYTATLGDSEIEVRGSTPVSVSETPDEVVITTGGTVVRVKKN